MTSSLIKPLRVDHWTKNLVLILGFIFAIFYDNSHSINYFILIFAFLILCISASSNYLINEFLDRGTDKFHPIRN